MHWKHWPYWLRGGVVTLLVGVLSWVAFNYCGYLEAKSRYGGDLTGITCVPFLGPGLFAIIALGEIGFGDTLPDVAFIIPHLLIWFLCGVLAGWLYSRMRRSKNI